MLISSIISASSRRKRLFSAVALALGFSGLALSAVQAAFTSEAVSEKNVLRGGSIEITAVPAASYPTESVVLAPGQSILAAGEIKNTGKSALRYALSLPVSGDAALCSGLILSAKRGGTLVYSGPLTLFSFPASDILEKNAADLWELTFALADNAAVIEATCRVMPTFTAWQAAFAFPTSGWTDTAAWPELVFLQTGTFSKKTAPLGDETSPASSDVPAPPVPAALPDDTPPADTPLGERTPDVPDTLPLAAEVPNASPSSTTDSTALLNTVVSTDSTTPLDTKEHLSQEAAAPTVPDALPTAVPLQ